MTEKVFFFGVNMTIKEIAEFTGKTERTIRTWISKVPNDKMSQVPHEETSQGIAHQYSIDEVEAILKAGTLSKDAVFILMENARKSQNRELDASPHQVDYRLIGEMIAVAIKEALKENISVTTEQKALPGPQMSKRDQLRRLITQYSHENGQTQREAWGFLYESAYYILHVNIRSRAQNRGMQKIDYIEEAGLLDDCIAIMRDEVA